MVSMVRMMNCKTCPSLAGFVRYGIADAICDHREFDNKRFDLEYYMYTAWSGAMQAGKDLGFLETEFASEYYTQHQILINADVTVCE
jgi:hypothetical protein